MRTICWFSCGVASAVASRIVLKENDNAIPVNIYIASEHSDNDRFLSDCERWYGRTILRLRDNKYEASVDNVIEDARFLRSPYGARCTTELKKKVRQKFQLPDDVHVYGYTVDEKKRAKSATEANPELAFRFPLIERGLTHQDCLSMVNDVGIEIPTMYKLGFSNNNCIGCVKSESPTYWNRVRINFPDVFARRARQERDFNYALTRINRNPVFLDELPTNVPEEPELDLSCGLLCLIALSE